MEISSSEGSKKMKMKNRYSIAAVVALAGAGVFLLARPLFPHCEIPCGIYDDEMRIEMMVEHVETMNRSIRAIKELSAKQAGTAEENNQLTRWIINKEEHCEKFQEVVWQYFMAQRIKPVDPADNGAHRDYLAKIEVLHRMIVQAMKVKQTVDMKHTEKLMELVHQFEGLYLGPDRTREHKEKDTSSS